MEYPSNNHEKNTRMTTISYLVSGDNYFCDFLNFEKCFKACADFYRFFVGIACNWAQMKCCCTDSPSTMIKFCCLLNERHKHIIVLPCALHASNLLAKDLYKFEDALPIVKTKCMIVNLFTSSHDWFHNSKEWVQKNGTNGK